MIRILLDHVARHRDPHAELERVLNEMGPEVLAALEPAIQREVARVAAAERTRAVALIEEAIAIVKGIAQ